MLRSGRGQEGEFLLCHVTEYAAQRLRLKYRCHKLRGARGLVDRAELYIVLPQLSN